MSKVIVFDMDGVLFDTERVGKEAWREAATEMGFTRVDEAIEMCRGFNRADTRACFEKNFPEVDYPQFHKRNHEIMAEKLDTEGMPIKTGAKELLEWLKENEWKVALATSTGYDSTMHHLKASGLQEYFQAVITGEDVTKGKPDPEIYLTACDRLGATPALSFAVEDSPNGIASAHAAKMRVIMVPDLVLPDLALRQKVVTVQSDLRMVKIFLEKFGDM